MYIRSYSVRFRLGVLVIAGWILCAGSAVLADPGVRITIPASMVHPGETFYVTGHLDNPGSSALENVPVYFLLGAFGEFWFWPSWAHFAPPQATGIDYQIRTIPPGTTDVTVLPAFAWPDTGTARVDGLMFIGAMLNSSHTAVLGDMAVVTWGYGPAEGSPIISYVNMYRAMAGLPPVAENTDWGYGNELHARYMVKNDTIGHSEDSGNSWYTAEGDAAARNSNLMVSSSTSTPDEYAVDMWMTGPFHAVGIIDPALHTSGFGSYRESDGGYQMGAGLDVLRGTGSIPASVSFPIIWPGNGSVVGLTSTGNEWPDPLASCPGYGGSAGLPLIVQLGPGNITPSVTGSAFSRGGTPLDHCVFDETSYTNPDSSQQSLGRSVLNSRDAVVLIPKDPLVPGNTYTASITANGSTITWSFSVSSTASGEMPPDMLMVLK
ncbi:MAG TPA: CAP domain-containing protein [bacterium]|nr:CAP domain-containing protein [bacterium]